MEVECSVPGPGRIYSRGKGPRVSLNRKLSELQICSGRFGEDRNV